MFNKGYNFTVDPLLDEGGKQIRIRMPSDSVVLDYQVEMVLNNQIRGILPFQCMKMNESPCFTYDVNGFLPLQEYFSSRSVDIRMIVEVLMEITSVLVLLDKYLLEENCLLLDSRYIYIEPDKGSVRLMYLPVERTHMREQPLFDFVVELLKHIRHEDSTGKLFSRKILEEIKKFNFCYEDFSGFLLDILCFSNDYTPSERQEQILELNRSVMGGERGVSSIKSTRDRNGESDRNNRKNQKSQRGWLTQKDRQENREQEGKQDKSQRAGLPVVPLLTAAGICSGYFLVSFILIRQGVDWQKYGSAVLLVAVASALFMMARMIPKGSFYLDDPNVVKAAAEGFAAEKQGDRQDQAERADQKRQEKEEKRDKRANREKRVNRGKQGKSENRWRGKDKGIAAAGREEESFTQAVGVVEQIYQNRVRDDRQAGYPDAATMDGGQQAEQFHSVSQCEAPLLWRQEVPGQIQHGSGGIPDPGRNLWDECVSNSPQPETEDEYRAYVWDTSVQDLIAQDTMVQAAAVRDTTAQYVAEQDITEYKISLEKEALIIHMATDRENKAVLEGNIKEITATETDAATEIDMDTEFITAVYGAETEYVAERVFERVDVEDGEQENTIHADHCGDDVEGLEEHWEEENEQKTDDDADDDEIDRSGAALDCEAPGKRGINGTPGAKGKIIPLFPRKRESPVLNSEEAEYAPIYDDATEILLNLKPVEAKLWIKEEMREYGVSLKNSEFVIGRQKDGTDLVLDSKAVGKIHAKLEKNDQNWFIQDMESKNGTYLNNIRLGSGTGRILRNNDMITIANVDMVFILAVGT